MWSDGDLCNDSGVLPVNDDNFVGNWTNTTMNLCHVSEKLLSLLFDVIVLLLIITGTPHSHIRACGPSAITHGMPSHMRSG